MKAQIEKYQKALDAFMKNEFWRELYETAPNGAKGWLEAEFDASVSEEEEPPDAPDPDAHLYMDRMTSEDWLWLAQYDSYHPLQKKFFLQKAEEAARPLTGKAASQAAKE